ncbi:MAG: NADH/ubiquinone/plastoquinone (complex I), partial [Elusimicrobia bacterium]|nr:NADH/ubiquinone/plastoquinone (complex I) [Candidatus Obscuribacterium magneticum]
MIGKLLPLFVVIPLGGAFFITAFGRKIKSLPEILGIFVPLFLCFISTFVLWSSYSHSAILHFIGGWQPPFGISLVSDGLTTFMLMIVHIVASCIAVYSHAYIKKYTSPWIFFTLFLIMLSGMNGVLITGDLFNLFVFMEIASLAACVLVAFGTERHELEAAFKYGVMNTVGALFILIGITLLYSETSTLNMADMANVIAGKEAGNRVVIFSSLLFLMGFGLKMALVPFHAWLPDAHPSAPAPISALLSGLIIKCLGIYSLFRIL